MQNSGEVGALNVLDSISTFRRRWTWLAAGLLAGVAAATAAARLASPVFEASVSVQIGVVNGKPLEEPRAVARLLESDALRATLPPALQAATGGIRTQVIEATPGGDVLYLRIVAFGPSPSETRARAEGALAFVTSRHDELFRTLSKDAADYEQVLADTVGSLRDGVGKLEAGVDRARTDARDSALPGALVLQAQIESKRVQHAQLSKELRDLRAQRATAMRPTRALAPLETPTAPTWPRARLFAVYGAAAGLLVAALLALLLG